MGQAKSEGPCLLPDLKSQGHLEGIVHFPECHLSQEIGNLSIMLDTPSVSQLCNVSDILSYKIYLFLQHS